MNLVSHLLIYFTFPLFSTSAGLTGRSYQNVWTFPVVWSTRTSRSLSCMLSLHLTEHQTPNKFQWSLQSNPWICLTARCPSASNARFKMTWVLFELTHEIHSINKPFNSPGLFLQVNDFGFCCEHFIALIFTLNTSFSKKIGWESHFLFS